MIYQPYLPKWEQQLLSLALEANSSTITFPFDRIERTEEALTRAYRQCDAVIREFSRSFYLATSLLPSEKKRAVRALYAFCRIADNIVDLRTAGSSTQYARGELKRWRQQCLYHHCPQNHPVALAWTEARTRYRVPLRYAEQLLDGLEQDLTPRRYQTFEELSYYCYCVASTVGLMSMHIIGFEKPEALPYAIKLGVALQLTNILRDVGEDLRAGRIYLPLQELDDFGLSEDDLRRGYRGELWQAFMGFQIERNRRLYAEAWPGIGMLHPDGRFSVAAAAALYQGILDDIEAHRYDVFSRRAHVGKWGKLRCLAKVYGKYS